MVKSYIAQHNEAGRLIIKAITKTTLKDMIGRKRITILEIGYVADTRYEDKYKARVQQHSSLCQILEKEGHEVKQTSCKSGYF